MTLTLPNGQTKNGTGTSISDTWDGSLSDGKLASPGSYKATLTVQSNDSQCCAEQELPIVVTEAPSGQCGLNVTFGSSAHVASGNLSHSQDMFSSHGGTLPAGMTLYYNSRDPANGSLGRGWSHNYDISLKENTDGSVLISEGNWSYKHYTLTNGSYIGQPGNYSTLAKNTDGSFILTSKNSTVKTFTSTGKLTSINDRNGNALKLDYSDDDLSTVTDPSGRVVAFTYDSARHLTSVTDLAGNGHALTYNNGMLSTVTYPDGGTWRYTYDDKAFMLSKTDRWETLPPMPMTATTG